MFKTSLRILATTAMLAAALPAQASTYTLIQDGFAGGGVLTGSFTGSDLNNDGLITLSAGAPAEVSDFFLSYSGGSIISAQTWTYADLLSSSVSGGLNYVVGDAIIGSGAADGSLVVSNGQVEFSALNGIAGLLSDQVSGATDVTLVPLDPPPHPAPEPASLALLGLGGVALVASRRRQA
jgi:hypothetical protein